MNQLRVQGRTLKAEDTATIGALITANPSWSRRRLSQELCRQWNWRNGVGQLKDMAARSLLVKLEQRGLIGLPQRRQVPSNRMRDRRLCARVWDQQPMARLLPELGPIEVKEISSDAPARSLFASALSQFHYLGFGGTVGENLQYLVRDCQGRLLACLVFGSSAWKCRDRDHFIGWDKQQRERCLHLTTNNTRFLILPWVKVPHLASWILGQVTRRLSEDWQRKYGHPIVLLETFVERDRFKGTAYRAANWIKVGSTTGRTRQDRAGTIQVAVKDIFLYPLGKDFPQRLCP